MSGIKLLSSIEKRHLFFHPAIKRFIQNNLPSQPIQQKDITDYVKKFN
ncbi:MAG: hypothetical protein WCL18_08820 [bacterium]